MSRNSLAPTPQPETDAELFQRIARGESDALGALYDRHHHSVREFVARATGHGPDVDDVAHDVFLTASRVAARFDAGEAARPFLIGIAAQLLRRRRRSFARFARAIARLATLPVRGVQTPEEAACLAERRTRFDAALAGLGEDKRTVFLLFEREGMSGEQIANALGIPVNTVWTRLHHARAELRRALPPDAPARP